MAENNIVIKVTADVASAVTNLGFLYLKLLNIQDILTSITKPLQKAADGYVGFAKTIFQNSLQIKAAFDSLRSATSSITETTAKFERFKAVLSTALSSTIASDVFMKRIEKFAAETPYSVSELTDSFVRLANRGVLPTIEGFRKMGDFASSAGKSFNQITEAILDAGSSPERWTEIGAKVVKVGNNIVGSYRGVQLTFENTAKGAMKMVEGFGSLQGVAGGMERQSATLGGKLSNLGDSMEQFYVAVGRAAGPVYDSLIPALSKVLEWSSKSSGGLKDYFVYIAKWIDYVVKNTDAIIAWYKAYYFVTISLSVLKAALISTVRMFLVNTALTYALKTATLGAGAANEFLTTTVVKNTATTTVGTVAKIAYNQVMLTGTNIAKFFGIQIAANTVTETANTVATNVNTVAVNTNTVATGSASKGWGLWRGVMTLTSVTITGVSKALQWLWYIINANPLAMIIGVILTAISYFAIFGTGIEDVGKKFEEFNDKIKEEVDKTKIFIEEMARSMSNFNSKVKLSLTVNPDLYAKQKVEQAIRDQQKVIEDSIKRGKTIGIQYQDPLTGQLSKIKYVSPEEEMKIVEANEKNFWNRRVLVSHDAMSKISENQLEAFRETHFQRVKDAEAQKKVLQDLLAKEEAYWNQTMLLTGQTRRESISIKHPLDVGMGLVPSDEQIINAKARLLELENITNDATTQIARFRVAPDALKNAKGEHKHLIEAILLPLNEYYKTLKKLMLDIQASQVELANSRLTASMDFGRRRREIEGINEFDAMQMDEYDKIAKNHIDNTIDNNKKQINIFETRTEQISRLEKEYLAEREKGQKRLAEIEKNIGRTKPEDAGKQKIELEKQQKELINLQMNYQSERRMIDQFAGKASMEQQIYFYQKEVAMAQDHMDELLLIEAKIQKSYIDNAKSTNKELKDIRRANDIQDIESAANVFNERYKYSFTPDWKLLRLNQKNQTEDQKLEFQNREKALKETYAASVRLAQEFKDAQLAIVINERNERIAQASKELGDTSAFEAKKAEILLQSEEAQKQIKDLYSGKKKDAESQHLKALALLQQLWGASVNNLTGKQEQEKAELRKTYFQKSVEFLDKAAKEAFSAMNTYYEAEKQKIQQSIDIHKERRDLILQSLHSEGIERKRYTIEQLANEEKRINELNRIKKEEVNKQKAIAQAQIVLQTAVSIANIVATQSALPGAAFLIPFEIALAIGSMFAAIAASRTQAEAAVGDVYEKGGIVGGKYHSQGGTLIEAERDEAIFSRKHTKEFRPLFDAIWSGKLKREDIFWGNSIPKDIIVLNKGTDNVWRQNDINRLINGVERISKKDTKPIRIIR